MSCLVQAEVDKESFLEETPILGYSKKLTSFKNAHERMVPSRRLFTNDVKIAIIALRRVMDEIDFMGYRLLCIVKNGHYLYAIPSARRNPYYAGCIVFHLGMYQEAFCHLRLERDCRAFEHRKGTLPSCPPSLEDFGETGAIGETEEKELESILPRLWKEPWVDHVTKSKEKTLVPV